MSKGSVEDEADKLLDLGFELQRWAMRGGAYKTRTEGYASGVQGVVYETIGDRWGMPLVITGTV